MLICGGENDPNITRLVQASANKKLAIKKLIIGEFVNADFTWDIEKDLVCIGGEQATISSAFIRRDVFHRSGSEFRAATWYNCICGWLEVHPEIRMLNRSHIGKSSNKLFILRLAYSLGLLPPPTIISNQLQQMDLKTDRKIAVKPVMGGGYCQEGEELIRTTEWRNGSAACPAIIQDLLPGPDLRVFRIEDQFISFIIESDHLDYRIKNDSSIRLTDTPPALTGKLTRLMNTLGLNWGAADFKYDRDQLYFLEVNSNPMFSVFDGISGGMITNAILNYLSAEQ